MSEIENISENQASYFDNAALIRRLMLPYCVTGHFLFGFSDAVVRQLAEGRKKDHGVGHHAISVPVRSPFGSVSA